jgi:beta-fructofuranosidase
MLLAMVEECGGIENIVRILSPDTRIIIEVNNVGLLSNTAEFCLRDDKLKQVTYQKQKAISSTDVNTLEKQLLEIGHLIAKQQLKSIEPLLLPVACPHRPHWHISPPQGLLNDPNGFIYHQGQYHLFYQLYPFACVHKDKYWVHLTSKDLINWHWQSVALTPSDYFDSHGVFSGHAISYEQELLLFYTGNVRIGEERSRLTTQCLARSTNGIDFVKFGPVIDRLPPGVTPHCRDPKVIFHHQRWLMLLGAQREDEVGRLAIYESTDLKEWSFVDLCGDELGNFGYMWECPDFFTLSGQDFIVICPQGIQSSYSSNTVVHHNRILKAAFNEQNKITMCDPQVLDYGFDFYAPQTLLSEDGRRIMSGWMGLPDEVNQVSVDSGWVHQLTALRELTYRDNKLIQQPIKELASLRGDAINIPSDVTGFDLQSKSFELMVTLQWGSQLSLYCTEMGRCDIRLNEVAKTLELDRSQTLIREGDMLRELALSNLDEVKLHILSDNSSLEIFIDNGTAVMSARVFTPENATFIKVKGEMTIHDCWLLNKASSPFVNI